MNFIGLNVIAELGRELSDAGIPCKIHTHDACGGQSFSVEGEEQDIPAAFEFIEKFFEQRRIAVKLNAAARQFYPR